MNSFENKKLESLIAEAQGFISSDKYEKAIEILDEALKMEPKDLAALYGKGLSLNELGKYYEALVILDQVLIIDPKNTYALNSQAFALHKLNRHNAALDILERALKINPNDKATRENYEKESWEIARLVAKEFMYPDKKDKANDAKNK